MPEDPKAEVDYCRRIGLVSNLGLPLRLGGRVIGAIAFTAFRHTRTWPEDLIVRLKIVGEVFAQALARSRRDARLSASLTEITRLKERPETENAYLRQSVRALSSQGLASRSPLFNCVLEEIA